MKKTAVTGVVLGLMISVVGVQSAEAGYLDPNVGGMLFQMLAALLAVISGFLFFFARQIRRAAGRLRRSIKSWAKRTQETEATSE